MRLFAALLVATFLILNTTGCQGSGDRTPQSESGAECHHDRDTFRCVKFLKNYDADTITFNIPGVHPLIGDHISVRVNGIDAPEIKGRNECEKRSARNARNLVDNILSRAKRIDLEHVARDKYFRILADVVVDGRNLKDVLLKNGLAYEYHGETKRKIDWCKSASGEARLPAADE